VYRSPRLANIVDSVRVSLLHCFIRVFLRPLLPISQGLGRRVCVNFFLVQVGHKLDRSRKGDSDNIIAGSWNIRPGYREAKPVGSQFLEIYRSTKVGIIPSSDKQDS